MDLPTRRCWCCGGRLVRKEHSTANGRFWLWVHESMSDLIFCREQRLRGASPARQPHPPTTTPDAA